MLTGMRRSSRNCGSLQKSTCTMSLRQCSADRRRSSRDTNTKEDHQYRNCSMEQCKQHNLKVWKGNSGKILITEHNSQAGTTCFICGMSWVKISAQKLAIWNDNVHGYVQCLQAIAMTETSNYTKTTFTSSLIHYSLIIPLFNAKCHIV